MIVDLPTLQKMFVSTLRDPDQAARDLLAMNLPARVVWHVFTLVIVLSVLTFYLTEAMVPTGLGIIPPFTMAAMVAMNLAVMSFAFLGTGRALNGQGTLTEVVLLLSWMQAILVVLQLPQLLIALALPSLGSVFSLLVIFYGIWLIVRFVKAAHRFDSIGHAIGSVVLGFVGITFGMIALISLLGL